MSIQSDKCPLIEQAYKEIGLEVSVTYDRVTNDYMCMTKDCRVITRLSVESADKMIADKLPPTETSEDIRSYNIGESDYSKHKIQPWDIWIEYKLNPFDADIIKRVLRNKKTDSRKMDYEKIIHICKERIRQIESGVNPWGDYNDRLK